MHCLLKLLFTSRLASGKLLIKYPEIDWSGVKKFRDIVAHHYFDIDAEQIFWIIENELDQLILTVKKMILELESNHP